MTKQNDGGVDAVAALMQIVKRYAYEKPFPEKDERTEAAIREALLASTAVPVGDGWQSRNDDLFIALELCSAELFAQCADQPRAMKYIERARKALAQEQCFRVSVGLATAATKKEEGHE